MSRFSFVFSLLVILPVTSIAGHAAQYRHYNSGLFLGLNFGEFTNQYDQDEGLAGATLKIGLEFDDFFGVEAHMGGSEWQNYGFYDYEERIAGFGGLFLRANLPLERHRLYALLGYSNFEFETSQLVEVNPLYEVWENTIFEEQGGSFGLGFDLFMSPRTAVNIQYMNYLSSGEDLNNFSVGFRYNF